MNAQTFWRELIAANRAGERRGIPSWCTAHPETLGAILRSYREGDAPVLLEATCNQVHQHGGYTGMTPADFRRFVEGLAREAGVATERLILGGDHLGPNPWKGRPARQAMDAQPEHWRPYVARDDAQALTRLFGLSDRIRYYWPQPGVQAALARLYANIDAAPVSPGLVSQCVGDMLLERREPKLSQRVISAKVEAVVGRYRRACGAAA